MTMPRTRKPKHSTTNILWYARGGNIARMGPFQSQVEAQRALQLAVEPGEESPCLPRYPANAYTWPEEVAS